MAIVVQDVFDPTLFSLQECQFLIAHLGEPPFLALKQIHAVPLANPQRDRAGRVVGNPVEYPDGVIPAAVKPALDRVYALEEDRKHTGAEWVGIEAVKQAIQVYLDQQVKWERDKRRGAPRFPSMSTFDAHNKPHRGAPGSDSGKVSTYFDERGKRHSLLLNLYGVGGGAWVPEWAKTGKGTDAPDSTVTGLSLNETANRYECFCGHTEHFKPESRSSFNAAKARMGKHAMRAKDRVDEHRELYTLEFSSGTGN